MGNPVIDYLDIWTTAKEKKKNGGRGSGNNSKGQNQYGIKKLRELILELAVRGILVPQDPNEVPAYVLLDKIAEEKTKLIKEGKIKKNKSLKEINENEKYFNLPRGWVWSRLGNICEFINGYAFKSMDFSDTGVGIVKIGDLQNGEISTISMSRVNEKIVNALDDSLQVLKGEMLIAMSGATTGKLGFNTTDEIFYINQRVGKILPYFICNKFLYYPLTTKIAENLAKSMGSAIPNLSTTQIKNIVIALPPLPEQHRIVAKVDELMNHCDKLEQQQIESNEIHQTLVETLLSNLTKAANHDAFSEVWKLIATNFDILFTTEESIDQLKQTILQLAVMGKLVPQDSKDEPAGELLKKIAKEKAKLIKEGKIKKQKPLPKIFESEKPFELPEGWEWIRFGSIFQEIKYGSSKRSDYEIVGDPVLRIPNIVNGFIDSRDLKFADFDEKEKMALTLNEGDLLLIRSNGSASIVGRSAVVDFPHAGFMFAGYLVRIRCNRNLINPEFMKIVLDSKLIRDQIELPIRTTSGVKNINSMEISRLIMPAIPIREQNNIVAKVDELIALCNNIKVRINEAQTTQVQMAEAIVVKVVN